MRIAVSLILILLLSACSKPTSVSPAEQPAAKLTDPRTVFAHLFEWSWPDIAAECETYLGPNGFAAVQVSPPQEHHVGPEWYVRYQPVSYQLESRSGSREEFIEMLDRCSAVNVDIYVDAVINHMTGVRESGVGTAGTEYGEYRYPPHYVYEDFNHCGRNVGNDIVNYDDRWEMQYCELVNLADLKTSSPKVQEALATYLNELLSLGVAGFRIDAAKHMPLEDLHAIMSLVGPEYFVFLETLVADSSVINRAAYAEIGMLTEFQFESRVADAFRDGDLQQLVDMEASLLPSADAVIFVDNHDSQRGNHVLTYKERERYVLANAFMLAHPYAYPKVMSSFDFQERNQGAPETPPIVDDQCGEGWICEHRWSEILAMVQFRNQAHGAALTDWTMTDSGVLAFGREDRGHIVLNAGTEEATLAVPVQLADGEYCNRLRPQTCDAYTVKAGELSLTVPAASAVALTHVRND